MKIEGEFAALKVCAGVGESCCDRATFGDLSRQFRCKVRQAGALGGVEPHEYIGVDAIKLRL
ncbi:hypothetical protein Y900_025500 [Mycolicibacterium aromaticivorans JS19b1 = JCM 16368]|uniref:Uncharacterized protein n=1 Tax=Mycolicibacterium aromaticivorans JS19b1 = JCM 16368 TaxID=1440774 RepID=A0A064CPC0_9MYCO|nr:hypothetical protein Y900_025500 [Mycolicibacterium aromaticivorans JS19b1 = JCM 16368]